MPNHTRIVQAIFGLILTAGTWLAADQTAASPPSPLEKRQKAYQLYLEGEKARAKGKIRVAIDSYIRAIHIIPRDTDHLHIGNEQKNKVSKHGRWTS